MRSNRLIQGGWSLSNDTAWARRGTFLVLAHNSAIRTACLFLLFLLCLSCLPVLNDLDRLSAARDAAPRSALSIGRAAHLMMRARYGLLNPIVRALRSRRGVGRETGGGPR